MDKKRDISDFSKVASDSNINSRSKAENEINNKNEILGDLMTSNQPRTETHKFKGYYLKKEVAQVIDDLTDNEQRGLKSELVNKILEDYFKENNLL